MKYRVLVIDDEEPIHYLVRNLLGNEFDLLHAKNAQEAIDVLSGTTINLILSDIHMPGLTGLELLESLRSDPKKKDIPVLIMTSLPTIEKEKKALDLGAADFIKKELFNKDKERILEIVRMKLVTNIQITDLGEDLSESKNKLVMHLMESALTGSFYDTVDVLCSELTAIMNGEFIGYWMIKDGELDLVDYSGIKKPSDESLAAIKDRKAYQMLSSDQVPLMNNHSVKEGETSMLPDFSEEAGLPAEIIVPLFSVSEQGLLNNNLQVPDDSELFSFMVIKRSVLFSSKEFMLISRLITQAGSILWRLYKKNFD